jgi:hypothetical protein
MGPDAIQRLAWRLLGGYPTNGFGPKSLSRLDRSYRLTPHEAWLQLIRAPVALRAFEALSPALQSDAPNDFEDILRVQLLPSAAVLFQAAPAARLVQTAGPHLRHPAARTSGISAFRDGGRIEHPASLLPEQRQMAIPVELPFMRRRQ